MKVAAEDEIVNKYARDSVHHIFCMSKGLKEIHKVISKKIAP